MGRGTKASFFAGGEELQGLLEVLDGRAHVLVLQGAAGVLAEALRLGEVLRRQLHATCRQQRRRASAPVSRAAVSRRANRGSAWGPPPVRVDVSGWSGRSWSGGGGEKPPFYLSISADTELKHFL